MKPGAGQPVCGSTHASITATLEPITAAAMSWIFLNESLSLLQVMGGVLVLTSVIILQIRRKADEGAPMVVREGKGGGMVD